MAIDLELYAEAYRRGLLNEDQNLRLEELERRGLVQLERPPIEQTQQEPLKTIGDINPLYLYLPNYIPVIFLAIFIFLIFKKKIKKGWTRLITFLSIIWLLIVLFFSVFIFEYYSYSQAIKNLPQDIKNCLFLSIAPIAFMFFVGWSLKWIVAGFKENK